MSDEHSGAEIGPSPSVWLFQANPKQYQLAEELMNIEQGDTDGWSVTSHRTEMRAGDLVILWQAGNDAGIYAIGELLDEPRERDYQPSAEAIEQKPFLKAKWWVDF